MMRTTWKAAIAIRTLLCLLPGLAQPATGTIQDGISIADDMEHSFDLRPRVGGPNQPSSEPICEVYFYTRNVNGDEEYYGQYADVDTLEQSFALSIDLDQTWRTLCSDRLSGALQRACPSLYLYWHRWPRPDTDGRCPLQLDVKPLGEERFDPLLVRWDLDLSRIACVFWALNCVARENGLVGLKGCVSVFVFFVFVFHGRWADVKKQMVDGFPWYPRNWPK